MDAPKKAAMSALEAAGKACYGAYMKERATPGRAVSFQQWESLTEEGRKGWMRIAQATITVYRDRRKEIRNAVGAQGEASD